MLFCWQLGSFSLQSSAFKKGVTTITVLIGNYLTFTLSRLYLNTRSFFSKSGSQVSNGFPFQVQKSRREAKKKEREAREAEDRRQREAAERERRQKEELEVKMEAEAKQRLQQNQPAGVSSFCPDLPFYPV